MPLTVNENNMDDLDVKVLNLLLSGSDSKTIAKELGKPLSTVQRRIRNMTTQGIIRYSSELNYPKLGLKKGLIHVYLQDGDMRSAAKKLLDFEGILEVATHIGNSDLVGTFVFTDSKEVLDLIANAKKLEGVEKVAWSEEVDVIKKNVKLRLNNS
ncbi:MAG: Lrp/AsnC family transcriptional regulator [Nitrososphaera sp.]